MARAPTRGGYDGAEERTPTAFHIRLEELRARHLEHRAEVEKLEHTMSDLGTKLTELTTDFRALKALTVGCLATAGAGIVTTLLSMLAK